MRLVGPWRVWLFSRCLVVALAACSSGGSTPDGGLPPLDGGATDGGITIDGGPLPDAGIACSQQSVGLTTCGVGGLECPRGQVCVMGSCSIATATRPSARSDHSLVYDPDRNRVILFGGDTRGTVNSVEQPEFAADTWAFDLATQAWEQLTPPTSPEARGGAATTRVGRRWMLFGGRSGTFGALRLHNDVWSFNLDNDQWTQVSQDIPKQPGFNVPDQRHRGRIAVDSPNNRLLIFGGTSDASVFGNLTHNDMWALDLTQASWSLVGQTSPWPTQRQSMAGDVDPTNQHWYFFGGARSAQNLLDEVWRFTFSTGTWENISTSGGPSQPDFARYAPELAYIPVDHEVFVFGGHDATAIGRRNDLWRLELNASAGSWHQAKAGDSQLRRPECSSPERREEHAMAYIQSQRRIILFGGQSDCGLLNDLWYYSLDSASWSNPFAATAGETCERISNACSGICQ